MSNSNHCVFSGNLTRDPELRDVGNGNRVVRFSLAINRRYKKGDEWQEEAAFVDLEAWGTGADYINEHVKKGDSLFVEAAVRTDRWKDGEGNNRSKKCN